MGLGISYFNIIYSLFLQFTAQQMAVAYTRIMQGVNMMNMMQFSVNMMNMMQLTKNILSKKRKYPLSSYSNDFRRT